MNTTKVRAIPTFIVMAALLVAGYTWYSTRTTPRQSRGEREVGVRVLFEPQPRTGCPRFEGGTLTDVVTVSIVAGDTVVPKKRLCTSEPPWFFVVRQGRTVDVIVEQFVGIVVHCHVWQAGREPLKKSGPRQAHCIYTVV